ncbi:MULTISPECIES: hypothetical protein [Selenomonas]|uniref:Uncharacterized protein n=1 Tax=Selenomonas ruminis TaxID=2593411 RepID=A0A5D6W0L3_9FIRM|nr:MULTISPECIES: hypothetical protein [unclassified Selenomonas]MBQ1868681.1 hypothetical protein [Selenomonas sp.]TYZ21430.1 hypothetical protein FZ040_10470 [Selenomonas sp. mPRGC5]
MENREPEVRVMSDSECDDYDGVTIDESTGREEEKVRHTDRIVFQTLSWKDLLFGRISWINRIAIAITLLAIAAFVIFVLGPLMLVLAGVGIVVWLIINLFFH